MEINILWLILWTIFVATATLVTVGLFINWKQKKIRKEFERFNSFDDIKDQIDSMIKTFGIEKEEKSIEVETEKEESKEKEQK
ncbi:MAG: hypothetical protein AM1032_000201 [Mycoplasmataceae bacterium]|nr:MAG: hypothetical protein AM1032_000201 [Mycoplasmataceae bacterium]